MTRIASTHDRANSAAVRRSPGPFDPAVALALLLLIPGLALADGGIRYHDFAADPASGIDFAHVEPPRNAILDQFKQDGFPMPATVPFFPHKPHGAPGVAVFDFDRDGDLDIYVPNSLGGSNSLYSNQLRETGEIGFVDVAASSGTAAVDHDSTGVCYGDVDNDGDHDLYVLGAIMPNRLYENQGDGTFQDITASAGVGGGNRSTSSCSMGDVNNDGLLDIAVGNSHTDWTNWLGIVIPYAWAEHNQLFLNNGGNVFADVSASSGIETQGGFPPENAGAASLTWAIALVDYDQDGDVDLMTFDDQGAVPDPPAEGSVNYGIIHLQQNDGTGQFTDRTVEAGLAVPGNWMGASFGDLNCDGYMDFFATNVGDYPGGLGPATQPLGTRSSRWFLGQPDGSFLKPNLGPLRGTVFGWGTAIYDYDNDGDSDVVYIGADDFVLFIEAGNPGTILQNQGCRPRPRFTFDRALADSADHVRRVENGLAVGDLNEDGFVDVLTMSHSNLPEDAPLLPRVELGLVFDPALTLPTFVPDPDNPPNFVWTGFEAGDGSLTVELSSADNGNHWAAVTLQGSVGLTSRGGVNRDGLGAVVSFSTRKGKRQMVPVIGGDSFASQSSLTANLGLGTEEAGTVDVLWPGGVRNRLRNVGHGEHVHFPEIPCDFDSQFEDPAGYGTCVHESLAELVAAGALDEGQSERFVRSAIACVDGPATLCLHDHRFQVELDWWASEGAAEPASVVPFDSDGSGMFYFFDSETVETHVNVIDGGCSVNGHVWLFAAASTNVGWEMRVTDTLTGEEKTYSNPLGEVSMAVTDTTAFATCP